MSKRLRGSGHRTSPGPGSPRVRIRTVLPGEIEEIPVPLPIHHHPAVALSLILIAATIVQIGVWRLSLWLGSPPGPPASVALLHGLLFDLATVGLERIPLRGGHAGNLVFPITLGLTLLSGWAWYGVARLAIGPLWGLWTGLIWVMHPAFAMVAGRAGPSGLEILLTSLLALSLCWWRYRGNPWFAAILSGVLIAMLALTSSAGFLFMPFGLMLVMGSTGPDLRRVIGGLLCFISFAATAALVTALSSSHKQDLPVRMQADLHTALGGAPGLAAVTTQTTADPHSVGPTTADYLTAVRRSPWAHARWFLARAVRSIYTTADRRFERPLLALQLLWIIPAVWGATIAARHRPWRWLLVAAACLGLSFWCCAALLEPLARNLTPIGGFGIILGLIGWADAYERFFGRRLVRPG